MDSFRRKYDDYTKERKREKGERGRRTGRTPFPPLQKLWKNAFRRKERGRKENRTRNDDLIPLSMMTVEKKRKEGGRTIAKRKCRKGR